MENGDRDRWALLVGIDRYRYLGSAVQLEGCVNDVQILRDALIRRFDFTEERMTVLLNEQATRDAMLAAMEELVRKVGEDDVVVFHFSGHGSQQTDGPEADEPDGWDETLVPYDSGRAPWKNRDIADDEIYDWLLRLTAKTPYVTLIIDACHSGTVMRTDFGGRVRRVDRDCRPHRELAVGERSLGAVPDGEERVGKASQPGPSGWFPIGERYVLIAACANAETAQEILVGEGGAIRHGALTYFVVQELMSPDFTGGTYLELFERLAPRVKARSLSQHPQVEGARHREIFGKREIRPMRFLSVQSRSDDLVVLEGGSACGLTVGSEWDVYARGTRAEKDGPPLGKVSVIAVRATSSDARILEERNRSTIQAGARAVETSRCLEAGRLRVEIKAPRDLRHAVEEFRSEIRGSKLLIEALPGEPADAQVYLLEDNSRSIPEEVSAPVLKQVWKSVRAETWAAVLADGTRLLGPALRRDQPESLEILLDNLENAARLRGIVNLRNDGSRLGGKVDFVLHRLVEGQPLPPEVDDNGDQVFTAGDRVVLEIRNRSEHPLYFYVIDIGLAGRVSLVYPGEGSCEYVEGESAFYVGRGGELPPLYIPEDFALLHSRGKEGELMGRETLKLFVTRSPASFSVLFNDGFRFRTGVAKSLNDFLEATFGGGGYGVYRSAEEEDWTTVEKSFLLRERQ